METKRAVRPKDEASCNAGRQNLISAFKVGLKNFQDNIDRLYAKHITLAER